MSSFFEVHYKTIGVEQQDKISKTHVAVIGVGGLGCTVAEGLIRLGVKKLTLIDGDIIQKSNIPRQTLYTYKDIGKSKVKTASQRLIDIFDDVSILTINDFFSQKDTLKEIDIVVDCTDNYVTRYTISKKCEEFNKPMIYGGVEKFEGQIGVFNYKGSKHFHETFPNLKELLQNETCESSGVLPFVVHIVANYQVIEVFKIITSQSNVLVRKLLCVNVLSNTHRIVSLK